MATVVAMAGAVFRVLDMRDVALVPVVIMGVARVAVVDVVGVVVVVDADVAAAGDVLVSVVGVGGVRRLGLRTEPRDRTTARLIFTTCTDRRLCRPAPERWSTETTVLGLLRDG